MPLKKNPLLSELVYTRDQLRRQARLSKSRVPLVCSDEALIEMASKRPLKKTDFKAIQGLDDAFTSDYAHHFLGVIQKHLTASINEVGVSGKAKKVLDNYKDRLANISRRNRNLFTSKLSQRLGTDLYNESLEKELISFITGKRKTPLKLTNRTKKNLTQSEETFYRALTLLYREINREAKEKGSYDLFIGYPFVEGKLQGEGFEIKAPLLFFPVKIERKGLDFVIDRDHEKDILVNKDLVLANNKFNRLESDHETPVIDHFDERTLMDTVLPYYKANKIDIDISQTILSMFEPYENTLKADFKKYRKGDLVLKKYFVLGKYTIHSSAIQADINAILNSKSYNDLIEGLVDEGIEPFSYKETRPFKTNGHTQIKEKDLYYINDLNYSQEKVINILNEHKQIVIWGPPGTGKSQTITSLIANQVSKKQNVLIVSEKKVALDVIHSRLGRASKYTLFIDDAQDKNHFYGQLKNHIDPLPPSRNYNNDLEKADKDIEVIIQKLSRMSQLFYSPTIANVPLYKIYPRYLKTKDINEQLLPPRIHDIFYDAYDNLSFERLDVLEKTFKGFKSLENALNIKQALIDYPLLKQVRIDLTRSEKMLLTQFNKKLDAFKEEYDAAHALAKRKLRKELLKDYASELSFLFTKKKTAKQYLKVWLADTNIHTHLNDEFRRFSKTIKALEDFNPDVHTYLDLLLNHDVFKQIETIEKSHNAIFDAIYTGYLEKFEAVNQENVEDLRFYKKLMAKLSRLVDEKKHICTESFEMAMYQDALNFSNSKRIMDIKRKLDSERKWSVRKFIDTFQLELFSNVKVWMMTPEVVSEILPLNFAMFDLVIFDEASQMYVEKGIPTIYRAKKVIIAGDTKQLRPSSLGGGRMEMDDEYLDEDDELEASLDAKSLLDLARYKYKETILNYHYRSVYEELIAFSNYAFYEGKLIVSPNLTKPKKPPIEFMYVEDGMWDNRQNKQEAKKVVEIVKRVLRTREEDETIGIITFNVQQRNLIEDYLDQEIFKQTPLSKKIQKELERFEEGEDRSLFIKNIENVQGDERDIIIFSTAYAKNRDGRFMRQFGWLNNEGGQNRLNVAISRAKKKIYFIASLLPSAFHVEDLKSEGPKLLKKYMQYCYAVSKRDDEGAKAILHQLSQNTAEASDFVESNLQKDIHQRLKRENLTIHTNIGIGGYTIDFGIFDEEKQAYVLGIILDYSTREKTPDVRNYFFHQEKYLAARGWNLYRVFAPNWYKDANLEMRLIRQEIREEMPY